MVPHSILLFMNLIRWSIVDCYFAEYLSIFRCCCVEVVHTETVPHDSLVLRSSWYWCNLHWEGRSCEMLLCLMSPHVVVVTMTWEMDVSALNLVSLVWLTSNNCLHSVSLIVICYFFLYVIN